MTTGNIHGRQLVKVIRTSFDFPPIGYRGQDWSAVWDDYDGAPDAGYQPAGYGRTEQEAIDDLKANTEEL